MGKYIKLFNTVDDAISSEGNSETMLSIFPGVGYISSNGNVLYNPTYPMFQVGNIGGTYYYPDACINVSNFQDASPAGNAFFILPRSIGGKAVGNLDSCHDVDIIFTDIYNFCDEEYLGESTHIDGRGSAFTMTVKEKFAVQFFNYDSEDPSSKSLITTVTLVPGETFTMETNNGTMAECGYMCIFPNNRYVYISFSDEAGLYYDIGQINNT